MESLTASPQAVAVANAKLGEHSLTPRPPSETGTLATHSGKNVSAYVDVVVPGSRREAVVPGAPKFLAGQECQNMIQQQERSVFA